MDDSPNDRVACPGCSKGYRWTQNMVGKTVSCRNCNTRFEVPAQPGQGINLAAATDDIYELDLGEEGQHPNEPEPLAAPANDGHCPSCNNNIKEGAVICMNCGFNLREGRKVHTAVIADADTTVPPSVDTPTDALPHTTRREQFENDVASDTARQHQWESYTLPTILLGIGAILALLNIFVLAPITPSASNADGLGAGSMSTGFIIAVQAVAVVLGFVLNSSLIFAGLLLLIYLFGASFGEILSVLLKIAAIVLFVQEVNQLVFFAFDFLTNGAGFLSDLFNWFVYLGLMCGLCIKLLDLDSTEMRTLIVFILVGRAAVVFGLAIILAAMF